MSTPIGSFQGLATGINWADMIDQIIQAESQPITLLQSKSDDIDRKNGAWTQVQMLVQALDTKAAALSDGTLFNTYLTSVTGMSGTTAPASVSASTSAVPGSYSLNVLALATREKVAGDEVPW